MLKGLVKNTLVKKRTTKYNKMVSAKASAYDKWQKNIDKSPVIEAEAPVKYETGENGELIPHKLPEPKIKVVPYAKVWEVTEFLKMF